MSDALARFEDISTPFGLGTDYLSGISRPAGDFTNQTLLALMLFLSVERDRFWKRPLLGSMLAYNKLLRYCNELYWQGFNASTQSAVNYHYREFTELLEAFFSGNMLGFFAEQGKTLRIALRRLDRR